METLADDRVCRSRGVSFSVICSNCQHPNLGAARFCGACGDRLEQPQALGERKVVTVLFADIVGSTELIGDKDPEHALDTLPPALARMGDAVNRFQGTIMRSMGDGLMVIFGVPQAQEDHALRACQAALAMVQSSRENGITLRVGIHSGEIVAGLPDKFTREQSVYGAAVHLASRLEHMAQPGDICVTESTFKLVHSHCDGRPLGHQDVKGFPRPIGIYRLVGMKASRTPFRDVVIGSYRGRDAELAVLHDAFAGAERGTGKAVGISAPPGLGKSRLCFEFARVARDRLVPVLELRASPYDHSGPLQPLVEFFRTFFRLASTDNPETARSKIASRIEATVPELIDDVSILADFLGIGDATSPALMLDPKTSHARLINLVSSLVRDGTRTPSVIIIEDIHWLDEASVEFVSALVDIISVSRVLLILTYRPTFPVPRTDGAGFHEIRLDELRDEDVSALTMDLIGDHPSIRTISERIVERSGGNPFFAEELIRSLVDAGELDGRPGDYEAMGQPLAETLPATVQTVIGARIDRLRPADKEVLQIGATIGREFPLSVLAEVTRSTADDLADILGRLSRVELVQGVTSEDEQDRSHSGIPLIQESPMPCNCAAPVPGRTAFGGGEGARTVSSQSTERIRRSDRVSLRSARDLASAAVYTARAATWSNDQFPVGAEVVAKVHLLLQSQPRSPETDWLRLKASGQIMGSAWREGVSAEEVAPFAREALDLVREMKDSVSEVLTLVVYGRISACTGSADDYVKQVLQAIDLSDTADPSIRTLLQGFLCQACGYAGKLREGLQASDTALAHIAYHEGPRSPDRLQCRKMG
jgi:adenylate cyclase